MSTTQIANATTVTLPEPGTYALDPAHSSVGFAARHLMVAKTRGRFTDVDATITVTPDPSESSVVATIQASSINTASEQRDTHLRSPDFFDVESFPTLSFRSAKLVQTGYDTFDLHGDLEIRGKALPVVLKTDYLGAYPDPYGNTRIAFEARTTINREDWGMTWNQALETGGVLVGKKIDITLEIQAVKQS